MLIDSHCHLPHKNYSETLNKILSDAKDFGVEKFITVGTSIKENTKVLEIANKYPNIFCSVGIYPHEDKSIPITELKTSLEENLKLSKKIVAVGECGVDISEWKNGRSLEDQLEIFEMQVEFAKEHRVPIIIHDRNGDEQVLKILNRSSDTNLCGVVHCFDSNWRFAKNILDLGFYISFSNLISYPKKDGVLEVVKKVPMNRFLLETDAPYLPPQSLRGQINYPKYVKMVAEKVAQVKQKTFDEISKVSYENTCSLFNI